MRDLATQKEKPAGEKELMTGSELCDSPGGDLGGLPPVRILRPPYVSRLVKKAGQATPFSFSSRSACRS